MSRENIEDFPISQGVLHHPGEVVPPHIGKATQPLTGGSGKGLRGIRCTVSSEGPVPSEETSPHPRFPIPN